MKIQHHEEIRAQDEEMKPTPWTHAKLLGQVLVFPLRCRVAILKSSRRHLDCISAGQDRVFVFAYHIVPLQALLQTS